jgi:hypothetical protein
MCIKKGTKEKHRATWAEACEEVGRGGGKGGQGEETNRGCTGNGALLLLMVSSNRICDRPTGGPGDYSKQSGKVAANGKGQRKAIKCRSRDLASEGGEERIKTTTGRGTRTFS